MSVGVYLVNKTFKPFKHTGVGSHSVGLIQLSNTFGGTFAIGFLLLDGSFIHRRSSAANYLRQSWSSTRQKREKQEALVTQVHEADGIDEDRGERA